MTPSGPRMPAIDMDPLFANAASPMRTARRACLLPCSLSLRAGAVISYHTCSRRGAKRRMERDMQSIRLAHISDIHVSARSRWRADDWFNKRLVAWLNLRLLGRGRRFRHTDAVLTALVEELQER